MCVIFINMVSLEYVYLHSLKSVTLKFVEIKHAIVWWLFYIMHVLVDFQRWRDNYDNSSEKEILLKEKFRKL